MSSLRTKAEAFVKSYAAANRIAHEQNDEAAGAAAVDSHFHPHFRAFVFGQQHDTGGKGTEMQYGNFKRAGFGFDYNLRDYRIELLNEDMAFCFLTWEIKLPEGFKDPGGASKSGWTWTNMYGFRIMPGQQEGKWELTVCDDEIRKMMEHGAKMGPAA